MPVFREEMGNIAPFNCHIFSVEKSGQMEHMIHSSHTWKQIATSRILNYPSHNLCILFSQIH
jgi:hypothetical protein